MNELIQFTSENRSYSLKQDIKILCVDDQVANLIALDATLAGSNYTLIHAHNGNDAINKVAQHDFAVILLDVQMPGIDGFETAKIIRNLNGSETTPIIFLTAIYPTEDYALLGYEAGAVDYLSKPLNTNMLKAKVAVFVELFKKNQEIQRQACQLREIERREQERELQKVKQDGDRKYQNLVEGIREGIVWAANVKTYACTFVSPHSEKITGYPPNAWFTDKTFLEKCLPKEEYHRFAKFLKSEVALKKRGRIEHKFIKADGTEIWLRTEIHIENNSKDEPVEFRGLSIDITQMKEVEASLIEAVQIKDEAIKLREDFLSIAAHELKTPITPLQLQMQSFIRLIESGKIDSVPLDKLKAMLEISDAQVFRLSRLIGQLLDASRLREEGIILHPETVNLMALIHNALNQMKHELEASDCTIILDSFSDIQITADSLRIEQVLINLLTNATKYAAGSPIDVSLKSDSKNVYITVGDKGMGIAKIDQKRIFGRFERGVAAKNFGGLGLGLYISKEIIELHHGAIEVKSEIGHGSKFTISLPL